MKIFSLNKITILIVAAGIMLSANAYAEELEVTMDVVRQSDAADIMEGITHKISLPKADMERGGNKFDSKASDNAWNDGHHMSGSMDCGQQMREHMTDAIEDTHSMHDHMKDIMGDGHPMHDDIKDGMGDGHPMHDRMDGQMR